LSSLPFIFSSSFFFFFFDESEKNKKKAKERKKERKNCSVPSLSLVHHNWHENAPSMVDELHTRK